jgi:hypothetical protein
MIVPISAFANRSMAELQAFLRVYPLNISSFHQRPAQLFEGVLQRLSIVVARKSSPRTPGVFTSGVNRWFSSARRELFQTLQMEPSPEFSQKCVVKVGAPIEASIYAKCSCDSEIGVYLQGRPTKKANFISYRTAGGGYWLTFLCKDFATASLSNKSACFQSRFDSRVFMAALSSSLFWWYYFTRYDLFNLKDYMIFAFRFTYPTEAVIERLLIEAGEALQSSLLASAVPYIIHSKTRGDQRTFKYSNHQSKPIIDRIDAILAKHYGFTGEELDFIVNYDIKYRLGRDAGEEE